MVSNKGGVDRCLRAGGNHDDNAQLAALCVLPGRFSEPAEGFLMPIRKDRMKLYPGGGTHSKEWKAFRASLIERAGNRCEGTPQHPECRAANGQPHPETGSKVVLTIAHMDHDESHADPERCRALCQRCHLRWDAPHHAKNAAATRRRKSPQVDIEDFICREGGR